MQSQHFFAAQSGKHLEKIDLSQEVDFETQLIAEPLKHYQQLSTRLEKNGILASFPEFEYTVNTLLSALENADVLELIKDNEPLKHQHFIVKNNLFHLKFHFRIEGKNYPHVPPLDGPYSYLPTITEVGNALGFLDSCQRSIYQSIPPLYHTSRYKYHTYGFYQYDKNNHPFILFPTTKELSLLDFIKTRSIPIGFLGVSDKAVFTDAYYNSPLDFYIHDFNHVRRYQSYNALYLKKHAIKPDDMYKQFNQFIQNVILPSIAFPDDLDEAEKCIRQVMTVLYFELLHEYALTPDKESIMMAFKHSPEAPSPFEHMIDDDFDPTTLESTLRMPNNNIQSGMMFADKELQKKVTIRYFYDKGPNFLTSAYNKLTHGFYDNYLHRDANLPDHALRTPNLIATAALRILQTIGAENLLTKEEILTLINVNGFIEIYPDLDLKEPEKITSYSCLNKVEFAKANCTLFAKPVAVSANAFKSENKPLTLN